MKSLIIFVTVIVAASCQIHTKLQADGYHYDRPQNRLSIPESKPKCSNGQKLPFCCENGAENEECAFPTPPPLPSFLPRFNLPSVIPIKPTETPQVKRPIPPFPPVVNLPAIIRLKPTTTEAPVEIVEEPITPPPLPAFLPKINLPSVIPIKPTQAPKAQVRIETSRAPVVVSQPTPFVKPKSIPVKPLDSRNSLSPNEYLPPVEEQEDEWEAWKSKYNKRYDSQAEDDSRRSIFYENVRQINLHNADYDAGLVTFDMEKNKFCDLTEEEFIKTHTGIRLKKRAHKGYQYPAPEISLEEFARIDSSDERSSSSFSSSGSIQSSSLPASPSAFKLPSSKSFSSFSSTGPIPFPPLPVLPSIIKLPSSKSLPVSPSSSLPVSPSSFKSNNQGQQNMTNVFMPSSKLDAETEDEVDWRKKGAITPVKNQGKCASCWAFSANGALEAHNFLRKGTGPIPLSEQNLIDCVKDNDGCDGGYMTNAYHYVKVNRGVDTEASYPYEEKDNTKCRFQRANVGGECVTHMEIQEGNEEALRQAVATVGPVAAGIDGGKRSFQFYKSGYYFEPKCEQDVNHAVLIVGYGKTDKGEEYWIGKNSWDTDWGEAGYVRMAKNKNNHCGITNLASYPIV